MKKSPSGKDREIQIELVRVRAALERESLSRGLADLGQSLRPRELMHAAFPRASSFSLSDWVVQAVRLARRYPMLASTVTTALSGVGKRRRWWKLAAGALVSWQLARNLGKRQYDDQG
ncbi:MAG: hypothetical protein WC284_13610 [Candidimonas sp.]|jgi:hypothetical protein